MLIKDILVANPQAAKSVEVMDKVDEKSQPFTQEMLAEILLGKYMVAAKEKLEAQVGWYRHSREMALKRLKQYYLSDTLNPTMMDSLADLLAQENGLQEKYELAFVYLKNGQLTEATNLINGLTNQFTLNTQQQELYEETQDYVEILNDLMDADTNFTGLTEDHKTILHYLAGTSQTRAGSYARNILMFIGELDYSEPILLPEEGLKSSKAFEMTEAVIKTYSKVKLYPNPARDFVIVELLTGNATGSEISLFDNLGRLILISNIPAREQQYVLPIKKIDTGVYIVNVKCNGKTIGSEKLTISK
ncbi:MAG: T9SS type A sorting domain-containing protein [Bacteroidales bacterium]